MKRGLGARPILKSDIEIAQANTMSAAQAAKYLNVSYNTYKKHAKLHGLWKTNESYRPPHQRENKGRFRKQEENLQKIITGERESNYSQVRLTSLLIKYGFLREECYRCGYSEQRITDFKVPLVLVFRDGNRKNVLIDNLEMVCFNCYHNQVGELTKQMLQRSYYKDI